MKRIVILIIITYLSGCTHDNITRTTPAGFQTDSVEGWQERCSGNIVASTKALCAMLLNPDWDGKEKIAFKLNLLASDIGLFPRGIRKLRFTHGKFAKFSVADIEQRIKSEGSEHKEVGITERNIQDLVRAVNSAYINRHDAGVLSKWVETPLCGSSQIAEGPLNARCRLLDSECANGYYDVDQHCCSFALRPVGSHCPIGACGGEGQCVLTDQIEEKNRVKGAYAWVRDLSKKPVNLLAWNMNESTVRVIDSDRDVAEFVAEEYSSLLPVNFQPTSHRLDNGKLFEIKRSPDDTSQVVLGYNFGASTAIGLSGPSGEITLAIPGKFQSLCAVQSKNVDDLPPVLSDCSTAGGIIIECPGITKDLSCKIENETTSVHGSNLAIIFDPTQSTRVNIMGSVFFGVPCIGPACRERFATPVNPIPGFRRPVISECTTSRGCPGIERCYGNGCACYSFPRAEVCNGIDDDCDGEIDEGGSMSCEDGIACTTNTCVDGSCRQSSAEIDGRSCWVAACARGICNGELPSNLDPSLSRTPQDSNGCQTALDHNYCESRWDQCNCNGASQCAPAKATLEGLGPRILGCSELADKPVNWACERNDFEPGGGDENACSYETCCETNLSCRHLRHDTQPLGSTFIVDSRSEQCNLPLATRVGVDPSGTPLKCIKVEDVLSESDRVKLKCNDNDPCTRDTCEDPDTGACVSYPVTTAGNQQTRPNTVSVFGNEIVLDPGCYSYTNQGCGVNTCQYNENTGVAGCRPAPLRGISAGDRTRQCTSDDENDNRCGCHEPVSPGQCWDSSCDAFGYCRRNHNDDFCSDNLECTIDNCNVRQNSCSDVELKRDTCLIDGVCYQDGETRPNTNCQICNAANNQIQWSLEGGTCLIDDVCYQDGEMRPGTNCQICNTANNQFQWSLVTSVECSNN